MHMIVTPVTKEQVHFISLSVHVSDVDTINELSAHFIGKEGHTMCLKTYLAEKLQELWENAQEMYAHDFEARLGQDPILEKIVEALPLNVITVYGWVKNSPVPVDTVTFVVP